MGSGLPQISIASEAEAWRALRKALDGGFDNRVISLEVTDWATIQIRIEGARFDSTITPRLMAGFIDLQKSINRAAARLIYDDDNPNRLTDEDRKALEFVVVVSQGSSKFDISLAEIIKQFIDKVGGKMKGRDVVIVIVTLALLYTAGSAWKSYLDSMAEQAKAETPIRMSQKENERLAILKDILAQKPALREVREDIMDAHHEMLKAAAGAKSAEFQGAIVTGSQASELTKAKRERSRQLHLDMDFRVLAVDTTNRELVRVKLRGKGQEFTAHFKDESLDERQVGRLKDKLMSRELVRLQVNATELRGRYTAAEILSVARAD
jgi:hypothetical protein